MCSPFSTEELDVPLFEWSNLNGCVCMCNDWAVSMCACHERIVRQWVCVADKKDEFSRSTRWTLKMLIREFWWQYYCCINCIQFLAVPLLLTNGNKVYVEIYTLDEPNCIGMFYCKLTVFLFTIGDSRWYCAHELPSSDSITQNTDVAIAIQVDISRFWSCYRPHATDCERLLRSSLLNSCKYMKRILR